MLEWLSERRGLSVSLTVPQRGRKRGLVEMAERNALDELVRDKTRRASDHNARSKALLELQTALNLKRPPFRIECYDMSHLQGTSYVGSMVVFEDGVPMKSAYRHFSVKTVAGNDDFAAMDEVVRRRLRRWDEPSTTAGARRGFAAPADLLLIDGGLGQLGVVVRALEDFELSERTEALRGGLPPRLLAADRLGSRIRGSLPAPAHPRRGAPVRNLVPPLHQRSSHDQECAGRNPWPWPQSARAADGRVRHGRGDPGGWQNGTGCAVMAARRGGRRDLVAAHA